MATRVIENSVQWRPIQLAIEFDNKFQLDTFLTLTSCPHELVLDCVRNVDYNPISALTESEVQDAYNQLVSYECYDALKTISNAVAMIEEVSDSVEHGGVTSISSPFYCYRDNPIEVTLTFKTPAQLAVWLALTNSSTDTAAMLCKHTIHDQESHLERAISALCKVNDWVILNRHLKQYQ